MIVRNTDYDGNYGISNNRGALYLSNRDSAELFDNVDDGDLSRRANVLVYVDKNGINDPDDSSMYLAFSLARDPYFKVAISSKHNPDLSEYADVVFPRFDPPINEDFISGLEEYVDNSRLFINNPKTQRYFSNKKYLEDIARSNPELLPRTVISSDPRKLGGFMNDLKNDDKQFAIYKPISGYGGEGIEKIPLSGESLESLIALGGGLSYGNQIILQEFIENIEEYGDKRIQIVNGSPIGAVLRKPKNGEFRCNVKKGGSISGSEITANDYEIIEKVLPILNNREAYWTGIDIVGPYLGEINGVSPGLLYEADELNDNLYGEDSFGRDFVDEIKKEIKRKALERNKILSLV